MFSLLINTSSFVCVFFQTYNFTKVQQTQEYYYIGKIYISIMTS